MLPVAGVVSEPALGMSVRMHCGEDALITCTGNQVISNSSQNK